MVIVGPTPKGAAPDCPRGIISAKIPTRIKRMPSPHPAPVGLARKYFLIFLVKIINFCEIALNQTVPGLAGFGLIERYGS
jgi:hypothetical protein